MDQPVIERHLEAIDRDGLTVVQNAIEPDLVRQLRDEVFRLEEATLSAEDDPPHQDPDYTKRYETDYLAMPAGCCS